MNEAQLGPTAQQVLNFMRERPNDRFTPDELSEHLDCTAQEIRVALNTLQERNLIERAQVAGATDVFSLRR